MLAADFKVNQDQNNREDESTSREERCKQWVVSNSGIAPKDMSSWDGSTKYDSGGSLNFEFCSGCSEVLDSLRSCHAGCCGNLARCFESWTSARSPTLQQHSLEIQSVVMSNQLDTNDKEAPRYSGETNFKGGNCDIYDGIKVDEPSTLSDVSVLDRQQ
jgi:hypothetical protein